MVSGSNPGGTDPDGTSIGENSNGQIEVLKPKTVNIGEFETDEGDWNGGSTYAGQGIGGSDALQFDTGNEAYRTVDASNVTNLKFYGKTNNGSYSYQLEIDGSQVFSSSNDTYSEFKVDLSSYSGNITLRFTNGTTSGFGLIDSVRLIKSNLEYDGEGGH